MPDVDGGVVARDEEGRAAGLVQERAMDLLVGVYKPLPVEEIVRNIEVASRVALSEGIASITEPGIGTTSGIGNSPLDLHAFQTARERGVLGVRAQVMPYITTVREIVTGGDGPGWGLDLGLRTGLGDNRLRVGPLKVLTDGSLIGRSAAMTACYHGSDSAGYMAWDPTELETILRGAHARRLPDRRARDRRPSGAARAGHLRPAAHRAAAAGRPAPHRALPRGQRRADRPHRGAAD